MNGRISTLLNMVGVESSSEAGKYHIDDIDYKKVDKKLEQERIKSIEFIKEKLRYRQLNGLLSNSRQERRTFYL